MKVSLSPPASSLLRYSTLPEILMRFVQYMKHVGSAPEQPMNRSYNPAILAKL